MGMAASQARFLGLTARKTNVEYEGQQVNQQRTTLANQSANYYNQLLGMTVPTPPSTSDYTKTVYTFEDGNLSNSITSLIAKSNGTYLVSYISSWVNDFTPVAAGSAIVTKDNDTFKIGGTKLRVLGTRVELNSNEHTNDPYLSKFTTQAELDKVTGWTDANGTTHSGEETELANLLDAKYNSKEWYVRYVQNTTDGTWNPVFYNKKVVDSAIYDDKGTSQSNINAYKIGTAKETEEVKGVTSRLEKDSTGRYINITLHSDDTTKAVTYSLTTNTITDEAAYEDAMNQYEYDKYQYDQSITEINAKIEIIQSQDKNLELRLKQLDTEQEAIQTEMDTVEKIIQKNVESTFKTFG